MADVSISYKGETIAQMDATDSKNLKTGGCYCEGDVTVEYAPRSHTYEITLAKASGWVLLTTLDEDVLAHINDPGLVVSLMNMSGYAYEFYSFPMVIASNTAQNSVSGYSMYGLSTRQSNETTIAGLWVYYPPNKTDTETGLGGTAFRLDGNKYYFKPGDGFVRSGTYRLTFTW